MLVKVPSLITFPTKEHVLATYGDERVAAIERSLQNVRTAKQSVRAALKDSRPILPAKSAESPDLLRSIFAAHLSCASVRAELQNRLQRARRLLGEIIAIGQKRGEIRRDRSPADLARLTQLIFMGVTIGWALNPDSVLKVGRRGLGSVLPESFCRYKRKRKVRRK